MTEEIKSTQRDRMPFPALLAISLYLFILAGVIIVGVAGGRHYPYIFLVFAALFLTASTGLMMLFRWAWALALGAISMLMAYNLWIFFTAHQYPALVQCLLNLVFFLYLIRAELRDKLR